MIKVAIIIPIIDIAIPITLIYICPKMSPISAIITPNAPNNRLIEGKSFASISILFTL